MEVFSTQIGSHTLTIESGKLAKQAGGAVLIRYGDTAVLVTATQSDEPRAGIDFFPLTVDYEERLYAAGKIPGGFIKREGRPSDAAILSGRLIDRTIRPLFAEGFRNDVQVVATVLSVDKNCPPDITAMIGASCALGISDIIFAGPAGAVRVGRIDGQLIINPTVEEQELSEINLVVGGTEDAVLMVEAGVNELTEDTVLDAIMFGHGIIREIVAFQKEIIAKIGKPKKEKTIYQVPPEIEADVREYVTGKLKTAVAKADKLEREQSISQVKNETNEYFAQRYPDNLPDVANMTQYILKEIVRKMILVDQIRPDGRKLDEVRPITTEVGILARTHGSGLFTRGQTQVLSITTLGAMGDEQVVDGLGIEKSKRYMHHYNFPAFRWVKQRQAEDPAAAKSVTAR